MNDAGEPVTVCPYCGVGCGVRIEGIEALDTDGAAAITARVRGDATHPANLGRLCSKGAALGETLSLDGRLLHPEIRGEQVDWDTALDAVATGLREVIDEHGPDAVAFYVSGQILTEDYYVANKLMKGFIGSGNIDTNSRLCMSTAVAAHKRAFGTDTVPGCYEDFELADLIVLVGSNTSWAHPVLYQRIAAVKRARPGLKVVVIDPRRTSTCDIADLHLAVRSGSDGFLFNGLLDYLRREDALDWAFLEAHTEGFVAALEAARESAGSIPAVAGACDLPEEGIAQFYHWFANTAKTVTLFSQGINQSSSGVDKANAILNAHLATGRIGKPGAAPFSMTGQPNAMGGREVGGLANQLAAHMDLDNPDHRARVARFWKTDRVADRAGLKAVELFESVSEGRIKAIWIMGTNPVVSLPDADRVAQALAGCEHVIVSDCERNTDTTAYADILLPALTWGEKEGTVTNSERRISRQRAFLPGPGEARPDWWIITQVARRLGFSDAFPYEHVAQIFREHAALSGFENDGSRDFDVSALAGITDAGYAAMPPVQWPVNDAAPGGTPRMFTDGRFFTASGRAQLVPVVPRYPQNAPDDKYPWILNTGRVRDQWHTMTRTGRTARLSGHMPEPVVQIHPDDAGRCGLANGALASVSSRWGRAVLRVQHDEGQRTGELFVPMHWSGRYAAKGRVGVVTNPVTDPVSGQPESKHTPVSLAPYLPSWQGFLLVREALDVTDLDYWVAARGAGYWRYELADTQPMANWRSRLETAVGEAGEWLEYADPAIGRRRLAYVREGRLEAVLFSGPDHLLPPRSWLGGLFALERLDREARGSLLSGRPAVGREDAGEIVCSCFQVGMNRIVEAIRSGEATSVEALGELLKAGTNCGSCIPELKAILAARAGRAAA